MMIRTDENWYRLGLVLRAEGVFQQAPSRYKDAVLSQIMFEEEMRAIERQNRREDGFLEAILNIVDPNRFQAYLQDKNVGADGESNGYKLDDMGNKQLGPEDYMPGEEDIFAMIASGEIFEYAQEF